MAEFPTKSPGEVVTAADWNQIGDYVDDRTSILAEGLEPSSGEFVFAVTSEMRANFQAIRFVGFGRSGAGTGTFRNVSVTVNGDSGDNYYGHRLESRDDISPNPRINEGLVVNAAIVAMVPAPPASPPSSIGQYEFTVTGLQDGQSELIQGSGGFQSGGSTYGRVIAAQFRRNNSDACTEVRVVPVTADWTSASRLSVYGVR